MSIISSYLPRVTEDVGEKIATLLLSPSQVEIILNQDYWKVISGCFGSGKSLCIKEIAQRLHSRNDGSNIFYICFDPYSLMEAEIGNFFKKISNDGRLQSLSLVDISSSAGYSVSQFYNYCGPPTRNISDLLQYLQNTNGGKCHILIDEFHADNINNKYCYNLHRYLVDHFQTSTVVIATQSITTTKEIIDKKSETLEQCGLEQAGMTLLPPLTKAITFLNLPKLPYPCLKKTKPRFLY